MDGPFLMGEIPVRSVKFSNFIEHRKTYFCRISSVLIPNLIWLMSAISLVFRDSLMTESSLEVRGSKRSAFVESGGLPPREIIKLSSIISFGTMGSLMKFFSLLTWILKREVLLCKSVLRVDKGDPGLLFGVIFRTAADFHAALFNIAI